MFRISTIQNVNFRRELKPVEEKEFLQVLQQGKSKLGNLGHSLLIVPSASLPQKINTGVGNLLDEEGQKFLDFAAKYWGINNIQLLPEGRYKIHKEKVSLYSGSSLDLGQHLINLEELTTAESGSLLSITDIMSAKTMLPDKNNQVIVDFENVILKDSPVDNLLKKAFKELLKSDTENKKRLLKEFETYKTKNYEWLEPKAIYVALSEKNKTDKYYNWCEIDKNFYNEKFVPVEKRISVIKAIRNSDLGEKALFYEFKQFLAEKHLLQAKKLLNDKGIKVSGDVLVSISLDEQWAFPNATYNDCKLKWGLIPLNLDSPEGEKLLRLKIRNFARRFDGLRIDAAWTYVKQPLKLIKEKISYRVDYYSRILNLIDDEIIKTKGVEYDTQNIMYEFMADRADFTMYNENTLKPYLKNRLKILTTNNISEDWNTVTAYRNRGWDPSSYILGTTNHDSPPLRLNYNEVKKSNVIDVLIDILKLPKNSIKTYGDFLKAKFAEPMRAKHNMIFFTEALNILERYKDNPGQNRKNDYRVKIPMNYKEIYFSALEKGEGFNVMDALEKAFVAEGLDKTEQKLFNKIVKYRKILETPQRDKKYFSRKFFVFVGLLMLILTTMSFLVKNNKLKNKNINR